jgi:hypothetical protein
MQIRKCAKKQFCKSLKNEQGNENRRFSRGPVVLDRDLVEKVTLLRARLFLNYSELIALAIECLYRKHEAKRASGDA